MTVIVLDNFTRANSATLGTANTGQTWSQIGGVVGSFGVNTNQALWTWNAFNGVGRAVIESGITNGSIQAVFVDPTTGSQNFGIGMGLLFRYVDTSYNWQLTYYRFPGASHLRLQRTYAGSTTSVIDVTGALANNDVIRADYCNASLEIFINDVSKGTYDDSANPKNYGTLCGLTGIPGSFFAIIEKRWDDFQVSTLDDCPNPAASWVIPALIWSAEATVTTVPTNFKTVRFDSGEGNEWYIVPAITDSGDELRSKVLKSVRVTGKLTNAEAMQYGYDVRTPVVTSDLEDGTNSSTGPIPLADTAQVAESQRWQTNVPNSVLSTVRVSGDDTGEATRDEVHEIAIEIADQGVRR